MPGYVTESGEVDVKDVRSKVGTEGPSPHSLTVLDLAKHVRIDLDLGMLPGIKDDPLKSLKDAAKARKEAEKVKKKAESKDGATDEDKDKAVKEENNKDEATQEEEKGKDKDAKKLAAKSADAKDKEKDKDKEKEKKPEARPVEVSRLTWSEDGSQLAVTLRSRDNKDRWIATSDAASRKLKSRHRLTDPPWINWDFTLQRWL